MSSLTLQSLQGSTIGVSTILGSTVQATSTITGSMGFSTLQGSSITANTITATNYIGLPTYSQSQYIGNSSSSSTGTYTLAGLSLPSTTKMYSWFVKRLDSNPTWLAYGNLFIFNGAIFTWYQYTNTANTTVTMSGTTITVTITATPFPDTFTLYVN